MFKLKEENIYFTDKKLKNNEIMIGKKSKKSLYKVNSVKQAEILYKNKKFYIHLCVCLKKENINSKKIENMIGLDPGSATFLSGFGTKEILKYQQSGLLNKLNEKIDKLKSDRVKRFTKNNNKKSKRRVLKRIEEKKLNVVNNMHWHVINDLCKNYEIICLEKFNSKSCVESNEISKFTKRKINDLKHYQFRQRLLFKANNQGVEVILVNPYLTSQYCSSCGNVKKSLKLSDRIYDCSNCNLKICRDINACKNMLMLGISSKKNLIKS
jgi:putative transposase